MIKYTDEQWAAIRTVDRHVLVSAAAGAGKTAVLAERCAYLVAEAPPPWRCDVDRLLVVTFTEAAAAKMKARIREALEQRARNAPQDRRLRDQLALLDTARISTLHSFCLWMVRRWFERIGIDATAQVLDENEVQLLRSETLDELFNDLYNPAGVPAGRTVDASLPERFRTLVDDYGLGADGQIADFVLRLASFVESLPDPRAWLERAGDAAPERVRDALETSRSMLVDELGRQADYCACLAEYLKHRSEVAAYYGGRCADYADHLAHWSQRLQRHPDEEWAAVLEEIRKYKIDFRNAPKGSKKTKDNVKAKKAKDYVKAEKKALKPLVDGFRDRLFKKSLQQRLALFSPDELAAGVKQVLPSVRTLTDLVQAFQQRYARFKQALGVLDFSDLERFAFRLLTESTEGDTANPVAAELRRRFAHVLVDEFQDINPLQWCILTAVSREASATGPGGNLFTVGDVKQSIYRFRLAEPDLFLERERLFRADPAAGAVLDLRTNFRSTRAILSAVNTVFGRLMRPDITELIYDERAALRWPDAGRAADVPVELHILARAVTEKDSSADDAGEDGREGPRTIDPEDPGAWDQAVPREEDDSSPDETDEDDRKGSRQSEPADAPHWDQAGPEKADDSTAEETDGDDSEEPYKNDPEDPVRRYQIGCEALLIAQRIRGMFAAKVQVTDTEDGRLRPLCYRDICVLLRSTTHSAEHLIGVFAQYNIPVWCGQAGGLFQTQEIRDVLALLSVLDNLQQDIPLAAVLRSGILGEALTEDELAQVRLVDRTGSFHEAVRACARRGPDTTLRRKVALLLNRAQRYRVQMRTRPLADVLWSIYRDTGYLAWTTGLRGGQQRRTNLLALHERARQFGRFRQQGLRRFLRFIDELREQEEELAAPPPMGEAEDVVRVMTIHRAKGLEFPVVFVADLGRGCNPRDRTGRILYDRKTGIGPKRVERDRLIEYPTALHQRCVWQSERAALAEELRVLYVAMTRARERLILVGSASLNKIHALRLRGKLGSQSVGTSRGQAQPGSSPNSKLVEASGPPLDWLLLALGAVEAEPLGSTESEFRVRWNEEWNEEPRGESLGIDVFTWSADQIRNWAGLTDIQPADEECHRAAAALGPLPGDEPVATGVELEELVGRLDFVYAHLAVTSVRATHAASEPVRAYSRQFDPTLIDFGGLGDGTAGAPGEDGAEEAKRRGQVVHSALEFISLPACSDAASVAAELRRLVEAGVVAESDLSLVDPEELAWFFATDLGRRIREAPDRYHREWMFLAAAPVELFDATVGPEPERALVRGVVDGLLDGTDGVEIVDFKTDRVSPTQVTDRADHYVLQMRLYARAAADVFRRPVTAAHLVFLHARRIVTRSGEQL